MASREKHERGALGPVINEGGEGGGAQTATVVSGTSSASLNGSRSARSVKQPSFAGRTPPTRQRAI